MTRGRAAVAVTALLTGLTAVPAAAQLQQGRAPDGPAAGALAEARRLPGALVRFDSQTGHARSVLRGERALARVTSGDLGAGALGWVAAHRALFGLSAADLAGVVVEDVLATPTVGTTHVVLSQRDAGRVVDGSNLTFVFDRAGHLGAVTGRLVASARATGADRLGAAGAVRAALRAADVSGPAELRPVAGTSGTAHFANTVARGVRGPSDLTATQVTWAAADGRVTRAWKTVTELSDQRWLQTHVDASTGRVLEQVNYYAESDAHGTVFPGEHPDESGPRAQQSFAGWVSGDTTIGNNADAYEDRDEDDAADAGSRPVNADQHFDYGFTDAWRNTGTDVDTDREASVTQLFYYTNLMHDFLYGLGFTEPFRNFQTDNFGNGGAGGDPVNAEARDGYGTGTEELCTNNNGDPVRCRNNANFGTPADGNRPRMQMYLWDGSRPLRDGSFDGDVIAHEYGHGLSNRLVGNGDLGSGLQAGSLGEGWSDTVSMMYWDDPIIGEYVTGNTTTGIRSVSYDTSPLVFSDFSSASGVHANGQIWATVMFDVLDALRDRYGDGPGLARFRQLMVDGLKSTPTSPTFLDARDGMLAADATTNAAADRCLLWSRFAAVEMGTNAIATQVTATPGTNVPAECSPTADAGGPYSTPEGTDVVLDGSSSTAGSDPSTGSLSYAWDLDDDGAYDDSSSATPTFTRVGQDGAYTVGLEVTNGAGETDTDSAVVTVSNVAPSVSALLSGVLLEGSLLTVSGSGNDPGWLDLLTATVDWGDGAAAEPAGSGLENLRPDATLSIGSQHHYGDNGTPTISTCVADDDTSTCEQATPSIGNVAPTVLADGGLDTALDEGDTFTLGASFSDPGWLDTHTAEVDWGTGDGFEALTIASTTPGGPGVATTGSLAATKQYGDDGLFTVVVRVTDDDGGVGSVSVPVTVGNIAPTTGIDESGTVLLQGVPTKVVHVGEVVPFSTTSTDPGSDDLTTSWDWDDGAPAPDESRTSLVNPPATDPDPSPTVQPRLVTDSTTHVFSDACLYDVVVRVEDDDSGVATDTIAVIIQGNADKARSKGYWYSQYATPGQRNANDLDDTTLDCYLAITRHVSGVFSEARALNTQAQATDVLNTKQTSSATQLLDAQLLAAWINFAHGAYDLDEAVDTNGDGLLDSTFAAAVGNAESVRLNPAASRAALLQQQKVMERLNLRDGG